MGKGKWNKGYRGYYWREELTVRHWFFSIFDAPQRTRQALLSAIHHVAIKLKISFDVQEADTARIGSRMARWLQSHLEHNCCLPVAKIKLRMFTYPSPTDPQRVEYSKNCFAR